MRKSLLLSMVSVSLLQACGGNDQIAVEALSDDGQEVSAQAISLIQLRGTHLGLDSNDVVRQRSRHVDELGHEHVRFERSGQKIEAYMATIGGFGLGIQVMAFASTGVFSSVEPELLKALACYEYQSCEAPDWEGSSAQRLCRVIERELIVTLRGWQEAPWSISTTTASTAAQRRYRSSRRAEALR